MKRAPFLMIAAPLMLAGCSLAPKTADVQDATTIPPKAQDQP